MRTQSQDTDKKTEAVQVSMLRSLSSAQKFSRIQSLTETTIRLSQRAIQRQHQGLDQNGLNRFFVELHYGKELASRYQAYIENKAS
ncbi:hypothetical protein ACFL6U_27525 [Planctomycetota bacterium]